MGVKLLSGYVMKTGFGDASNWGLAGIREVTGYPLVPGTLNLKLDAPHKVRSDFHLPKERRADRRPEDLDFERCRLLTGRGAVRGLIARTSTNAWGDEVLEIMAEQHLRSCYELKDWDRVSIHVWIGADAAAEAEAEFSKCLEAPMMRKGYVFREDWREEGEKKIADYWFDSNPQSALFWDTREGAEAACTIFENRTIIIPSADGGEYRCTGFTVEELDDKFVVFCHAPFIPIAGRAV